MHDRQWAGTACALLAVLLTGCQSSASDGAEGERTTPRSTPSVSATVPVTGFGTVFLDIDECSSFGTTSFTEVPCGGERAAARVVARHGGKAGEGPLCPATTDFVLHIDEQPAAGTGRIPRGYACMRNLQPPHPGDPGAGGGPRTIVGDCLYGAGDGQVRETACDGSGPKRPQYKVVSAVDARPECPASTALYVQLGGAPPVGCARPV
ncbi:hypothetical protein [Streptomyces aurantiogriseus]|uniref:Lipoprotein n=1 Tax=Streptomyces aurantiogriseus TaxID=66870 RepID=A0A918KXD1_9ACTN|nr:hypothetical protein [Streptomyces aurantiogriseus]GGR39635.1 hypothetical protein GCM10010251_65310 [Streptomyces aurantiogriseus]